MPSTRWLTGPQERAWRRYRRMRTLLDLQIARDLNRDSGLSETDYDVLSTLSEQPGSRWRARDLAAQLLWSTSRLAHHVGRMEQRGLVNREPTADDGRGAIISLTEQGRAVLHQAAPPHVASVRRNLIDLLTEEEVATLDTIAEKVIAKLAPSGGTTPLDPNAA
ncbi:MAG TPA: MarR family winged helix-turn-helix transcriptional regulator [Streptosporangiaceae bacterium]